MANPYYVDPMGGYGPSIVQGLAGIGQGLGEQRQAEQQAQQQQAAQQAVAQAYASGDPDQVAQAMFKHPDMSKSLTEAVGFRNEATKNNLISSARSILANPARTEEVLQSRIKMVRASGGDPTESEQALEEFREDPQGFIKNTEMTYAGIDPEGYAAYKSGAGEQKPTANIKDYEYYQELLKTNPEEAEQFARQVGIDKGEKPELKPTVDMQNLEQWRTMPDGPEKDAFAKMIGVDPQKSYADIRANIGKAEEVRKEIVNATSTVDLVDSLLGSNDYLDAVTGVRGAIPVSVPGTTGFDAMVAFDQLKNSLTLDNLSKMSGVLSDTDIKILQSAGAGLEPGMSKSAMKGRLNKIKSVLMTKTKTQRKKLKALGFNVDAMTGEADKPINEGPVNWSDL